MCWNVVQFLPPEPFHWCICCRFHISPRTGRGNLPHSMALHPCNIEKKNGCSMSGDKLVLKTPVCPFACLFWVRRENHMLFAHSLADVLSGEDHVAGPTSEAADVPLLLQRQERLTLLDLGSTPGTVWRRNVCERKKEEEWEKRHEEGKRKEVERRKKGKGRERQSELRYNCTSLNTRRAQPLWHSHLLNQ